MDLNQALAPARPLLVLAGQVLIVAGLLKFFGVGVPLYQDGLHIAFAGWLLKNI